MINRIVILSCILILSIFSVIIFSLFLRKEEKFMKIWGYAWIIYIIGIALYLIYSITGNEVCLELRKITDMYNVLCLLIGCYSINHIKLPEYWMRFSLYMTLLALVCMVYKTKLLTFYLPIVVFQIVVTAFIVVNIARYWRFSIRYKALMICTFTLWGVGKAGMSIVEIFINDIFGNVVVELVFASIVNFCILVVYSEYVREKRAMAGNLYKKVVDSSEDALFYFNIKPVYAYEYISPACMDITGYSQEEFYKNSTLLHTISQNKTLENFLYDIIGNEQERGEVTFKISKKNGESIWLEMKCSSVFEDGAIHALEGVIKDVTVAHTRSMEQIRVTNSRNMLFSYISHELRTPVTSLAGYITALEDGTFVTEEERKEAMEIISSKTSTLKKLIDDLDQMSKLETYQFTFDFQVYNVREVVDVIIANSAGDIEKNGFIAEYEYIPSFLSRFEIVVDLERINQVYTNLISNALKYSNESKRIWINFRIDELKENFICSVKDEGIGIDGSDLNHIFDSFFRAETNRSSIKYTEGRGLGLALCKEIVCRHNGQIYVDSTYGKGSEFTFMIPLFKEE